MIEDVTIYILQMDDFFNRSDIIVNEKYKQLFIFHQFDSIRIIRIFGCSAQGREIENF